MPNIPRILTKTSVDVSVAVQTLNHVTDFAEYLEINLSGIEYEIRRFSDSLAYKGGPKSLQEITQAMIQKSKGFNIHIEETTSVFDEYEKKRIDEVFTA